MRVRLEGAWLHRLPTATLGSDVRVVRAFSPASKVVFIVVITSGLQPARDLLFLSIATTVSPAHD